MKIIDGIEGLVPLAQQQRFGELLSRNPARLSACMKSIVLSPGEVVEQSVQYIGCRECSSMVRKSGPVKAAIQPRRTTLFHRNKKGLTLSQSDQPLKSVIGSIMLAVESCRADLETLVTAKGCELHTLGKCRLLSRQQLQLLKNRRVTGFQQALQVSRSLFQERLNQRVRVKTCSFCTNMAFQFYEKTYIEDFRGKEEDAEQNRIANAIVYVQYLDCLTIPLSDPEHIEQLLSLDLQIVEDHKDPLKFCFQAIQATLAELAQEQVAHLWKSYYAHEVIANAMQLATYELFLSRLQQDLQDQGEVFGGKRRVKIRQSEQKVLREMGWQEQMGQSVRVEQLIRGPVPADSRGLVDSAFEQFLNRLPGSLFL